MSENTWQIVEKESNGTHHEEHSSQLHPDLKPQSSYRRRDSSRPLLQHSACSRIEGKMELTKPCRILDQAACEDPLERLHVMTDAHVEKTAGMWALNSVAGRSDVRVILEVSGKVKQTC